MSNKLQKSIRRPSKISQQFSKEDLQKVWGSGQKSFASIGKDLNICPKALKQQMIDYDIIPYVVPERHKHLTKQKLEEDYTNIDIKSIAKKYNVSQSTINLLFDYFEIERKHIIYSVDEKFFNQDTPETFYVAGLWAADGCVTKNENCIQPNRIQLGLKAEDREHLEKVKNLLNYYGKLFYKNNEYPSYSLEIGSVKIAKVLNDRFDIGERKSLTYKMPEWLLTHPFINYFLLGYFDGDGGFYLRPNGYDACIGVRGTIDFLQQYHKILFNNGVVEKKEKVTKISSGIGRLIYGGIPNCYQIYKWLHKNSSIHLDRKYKQFEIIKTKYQKDRENQNKIIVRNADIMRSFNDSKSYKDIAIKYDMHETSVANIIREHQGSSSQNNKLTNFYEPLTINNTKLTKLNISLLNVEKRNILIEEIFSSLRKEGLNPFLPINEIKKEYEKLQLSKIKVKNNEINNFTHSGDVISKIYCYNFYDVKIDGRCSIREAFEDDVKLRLLIKNKLGLDEKNGYKISQITISAIINDLKSMGFCLTPSIFRASTAKAIYEELTKVNDTVLDYSAGWGGRMMGAAACGRKYIGIDPLNTNDLISIEEDLELNGIELINGKSEEIKLEENSVDFAFSSPPYYNTEIYSNNDEQAYNNSEEYFYETYWKETLINIKTALKPNKMFGVNIRNNKKMLNVCEDIFGEVIREIKISTPVSHLSKKMNNIASKYEIVYLFQNHK